MRKTLAIVALLCGAVSASAAPAKKWCSEGFDKPAEITLEDSMRMTIGGQQQEFDDAEVSESPNAVRGADLRLYEEDEPGEKQHVIIFRDRVFWPCP